jgi:hypothetical protein
MTEKAEKPDLKLAEEGVKSLYKAPQQKVLDPQAMDKSLLDRMPQPTGWRMLILPYRGKDTTDGGIKTKKNSQMVRGVRKSNGLFLRVMLALGFVLRGVSVEF